jgi:hypothetical protein
MTNDNTKLRYQFAMSAFARMHGRVAMTDYKIREFCGEWATWDVHAPLDCLNNVDQYFYYEYKNWRGW